MGIVTISNHSKYIDFVINILKNRFSVTFWERNEERITKRKKQTKKENGKDYIFQYFLYGFISADWKYWNYWKVLKFTEMCWKRIFSSNSPLVYLYLYRMYRSLRFSKESRCNKNNTYQWKINISYVEKNNICCDSPQTATHYAMS